MKAVVKIGGSLIKNAPSIIKNLQRHFDGSKGDRILIVPGGGVFVASIKKICSRYSIKSDASHWMAVLSMQQYAYYMIDKTGVNSTDSINDFPVGVSLLLPYKELIKKDPLPHSWNVTSDTIAAWVAKETEAHYVKATDVDGVIAEDIVQEILTAKELSKMELTCVDRALPGFLMENRMDCIVVNGKFPERVIDAVLGENVVGTHIKGNI